MHSLHANRPKLGREEAPVLLALVLVGAGFLVALVGENPGGVARALGSAGLAAALVHPAARAGRMYRAGVRASMPTAVARVRLRTRPAAGFNALSVTLALGLPLAGTVSLLALVEWAWMPLAGVLLVGCVGIAAMHDPPDLRTYAIDAPAAAGLLERLCMRADMAVPELIAEHDATANCWTAGGRINVTTPLLEVLDEAELEAVLAHEVAHIAHRDAAVMEICSAPSRVLLGFAGFLTPRLPRLIWASMREGAFGVASAMALMALCIPPAFVIGWISRLSVLGMSRAREFSADAAAAALAGRPSALASALMKLDRERDWSPRADLRSAEANAVLCIVGTGRRRLGRLLSTHPPIAARVTRLEGTEARIQTGPYRVRV